MREKLAAAVNGVPHRRGLGWLIAATLYFILAIATISFTSNGRDIAALWPADAVLLAMLLSATRPRIADILSAGFVANIAANVITRDIWIASMLYSASNMAGVAIATLLLRSKIGREDLLSGPRTVGWFILVAGVLAPALSALGGALTASLLAGQDYIISFRTWFMSDSLGLLVFTPFLRAAFDGDYQRWLRVLSWSERGQLLLIQGINAAIAAYVFFIAPRPLLFALFAPVMLATFRLGALGTKLAVLSVAIIGTIATVQGLGPVSMLTSDMVEQSYSFQAFLLVLLLTFLPASAELSARKTLLQDLAEKEKALRLRETELSHLASTDSLTGLLNRAAFREQANLEMWHRGDQALSLVEIDLNGFKDVNDNWGHHTGDAALVHIAAVLRSQLRGNDLIGRIGGDEFMLLLPGIEIEQAQEICERLKSALKDRPLHLPDGPAVALSMSCGVAGWSGEEKFDELARLADGALYKAKAKHHRKRPRLVA